MDIDQSPSRRDYNLMKIAEKMALMSDGHQKLGAVVVRGGAIVGKSYNKYFNGIHAEVATLGKQWKSELQGCVLYVCRLRKQQPWGLARPCPECEKIIRQYGISKVYYTTNDPENPIACERY